MANQPPPSFTSNMAARAVAPRRLLHERMRRQWRPSTPPQNALSALGSPWPKSPSSRTGMVPALGFTIAVARRVDASNNRDARVPQAQGGSRHARLVRVSIAEPPRRSIIVGAALAVKSRGPSCARRCRAAHPSRAHRAAGSSRAPERSSTRTARAQCPHRAIGPGSR